MGRHQKQPNDCSCSHRELFGAPENVEKSSTSSDSSRVTHATSSLQYCSKPVHSQVYLTGSYTKPSNDHSHWHREPFLIPKNVGKSSTSPASSCINRETSRLQYSSNLVHSPVYMTGSCHEQPNDHSCLRREPFGVPKNVEKSSTSTESSRVCRETSSLRYSSKPAHSPVYATGSCTNRSNNSSCQHREPLVVAKNVEKTSTLSTSSHINCETSSSQNRSMLVQSPVHVTGNCAKQSNNNSCSRREPFLIAKNVEKISTSSLPSRSHSETSSSAPRREPVQTPVYKTGNHPKHSWNDPRLHREPVLSERNVEKVSTLRSSSHNCSETSASSRNERIHSNMDKESMSPKSTHKPASISPLSKALLDFVQFPPEWRVGSTERIIARLEVWESIRKTKAHSQCLGNPRSGGQPSSHGLNMHDISYPSLDMREQRGFSQNMVERHHIGPQDDHPHSGPGSSGGGRWSSQLPFGKSPIAEAMPTPVFPLEKPHGLSMRYRDHTLCNLLLGKNPRKFSTFSLSSSERDTTIPSTHYGETHSDPPVQPTDKPPPREVKYII
ncbi:uncharacterized protein EI90DRAFT_3017958 [Cantharellus anzutake]|uniref:uncharacterized protein n=1 Tax=Cantharellus anzutake TaxID=1750568 RepID=UPI001903947D|nr:uncharacterized protein EI90DRAFT_3017958 [Cantharellus anzutake]KAF8327976.1 hypothetical protein EI90DRAFT_3017958 [Cantharellus anzutake]